jgi:hypothetical protein
MSTVEELICISKSDLQMMFEYIKEIPMYDRSRYEGLMELVSRVAPLVGEEKLAKEALEALAEEEAEREAWRSAQELLDF